MARDDSIIIISSSPEFPSITDLVAKQPKKPTLRSGLHVAPIPDDALTSFTTASSIWRLSRDQEATGIGNREIQDVSVISLGTTSGPEMPADPLPTEPTAKPKTRKKPTARKKKDQNLQTVEKDEAVSEPLPAATDTVEGAKAPMKRRSTKVAADGQTTLPKGKVTKPTTKQKAPRKKAETVSRHFTPDIQSKPVLVPVPHSPTPPVLLADEPLHLEQATRRRISWTPPPDGVRSPVSGDPLAQEITSSVPQTGDPQQDVFKNLRDTFGRAEQAVETAVPTHTGDILGKRKLIQLVATTTTASIVQSKSPNTSPAKAKAPKKKPRTITELATSAYRDLGESEQVAEAPKSQCLTNYFPVKGVGEDVADGTARTKGRKPAKKPAKPKATKKKADTRHQMLLSPTSAMRQVVGQDFVFGTASQLATEDDPDLLRALHQAMKESNEVNELFGSSPVVTDLRRRVSKKLWAAGNRDGDGDLLDLEILDLTESPPPPRVIPANHEYGAEGKGKEVAEAVQPRRIEIEIPSSDFDPIDDLVQAPPKSHVFSTQPSITQPTPHMSPTTRVRPLPSTQPIVAIECDFEPPPSNQEHNQLLEQSQSASPPEKVVGGPPRPKYELYTDAQLAREISKFGFKSVKRRNAMIALLDQCWASTASSALGTASMTTSATDTTVPAVASSAPASTRPRGRPRKDAASSGGATKPSRVEKRPRGRPKKDSTAAASSNVAKSRTRAAPSRSPSPDKLPEVLALSTPKRGQAPSRPVLEVPDSDAETDPFLSSPASAGEIDQEELFSSPRATQLDVSITEDTEMSLLAESPTTQQEALFQFITRAVTSAPRTRDPANPSWHEKMLMYDPIILEDLAAWLNGGQLDSVGYDGEVAPGDVKKWCESNSVCCLWRVNLNGKERKRF